MIPCCVCTKPIDERELVEAKRRFPEYRGERGWMCDECWATSAEFIIGVGIPLPDWVHDLLRKVRGI